MSIAEVLLKLEELRRSGILTAEEFAQVRAKTLAGAATFSTGEQVVRQLLDQLAEARCEKDLAQLDLEWELEHEKHYLTVNRRGKRILPKTREGIKYIITGVVFALIAVIPIATGLLVNLPLWITCFPVWVFFGVLAMIFTGCGLYQYAKAKKYEKALAAYQSRRFAMRAERYDEFPQALAMLQPESASSAGPQVVQLLTDQLAEVRYQSELARLDLEWEIERQKYYITTRRGGRTLPASRDGIGIAIGGMVFGLAMTLLRIPSSFPFFGLIFAVLGIASGIYHYNRATVYEKALASYQSRRSAIRPEQFR